MNIKRKIQLAGIAISLVLFLNLGMVIYLNYSLDKGFQTIIVNSEAGVEKSNHSDSTLTEVNNELEQLTTQMKAISKAVQKSNMSIKSTARKIKGISEDLTNLTETVEEIYEISSGDVKDSLEIVADDISDIQMGY